MRASCVYDCVDTPRKPTLILYFGSPYVTLRGAISYALKEALVTRTMTADQERRALVGELTKVALAHVNQNAIIESAQGAIKKLAAEERRILKQLDDLDADTGNRARLAVGTLDTLADTGSDA